MLLAGLTLPPFARAADIHAADIHAADIHAADIHAAERSVMDGNAVQAAASLIELLRSDPNNAAAHLLLCRLRLSLEDPSAAASECELALKGGLANASAAQDWAGRAFGMQAEHAGPFTGMRLAGRVRDAFEAAHRLDPHNRTAAVDLGMYYIAAPGIVGGGADKAKALADSLQASLPEVAHRLRGLLAEKQKDGATAEREFQAETVVAQDPAAYANLAVFYARTKQAAKAAAAARKAVSLDRGPGPDAVDAASVLASQGQPAEAIPVLRAYLAHGQRSDAAPAFRVLATLALLLKQAGDPAGARSALNEALALAPTFHPARVALASL